MLHKIFSYIDVRIIFRTKLKVIQIMNDNIQSHIAKYPEVQEDTNNLKKENPQKSEKTKIYHAFKYAHH